MNDDPNAASQPVTITADPQTHTVTASAEGAGEIAPPPATETRPLWTILIVLLATVVLSADVALIYGFVAGRVSSETVLLIFTTTIASLIGLYTQRPGAR